MLYVYFGHIYAAFSIGTCILAEFSPLNLFYYKQLHAELRRSVMLYEVGGRWKSIDLQNSSS